MEKDYTDIFFIEKELAEFYRKNKSGKGSGFGRRLIDLYATQKYRNELLEALKEIAKGNGAYDMDKWKHAENCIENMKDIALTAIKNCTK